MVGTLKKDGETWYVEYQEESTSSLSTGTPSKFALRADNIERIVNGTWEAVEGKRVRFEVKSLPLPPYYEVDLDRSDMAVSVNPFHPRLSPTTPQTKKMKTRYRYRVSFGGSTKAIVCDEVVKGNDIYFFYKHVKIAEPRYEYDGYHTVQRDYDREEVAMFPIINTAIYEIEKFQEEEK